MIIEANDKNFDSEINKSKKLVLVDFWAEWCAPCRSFMPVVETVVNELSDKVDLIKINIDDSPEIPTRLGVRSIPTLILFKDGKQIEVKVGTLSQGALTDWIKKNL